MDSERLASTASGKNDRIMAALAHVSVIVPFTGIIVPIVIWVTQKDKSPSVAFQALQALAYQLMLILAFALGMGCYVGSSLSMFVPMMIASGMPEASASPMPPALEALFWVTVFGPILILVLYLTVHFSLQAYGLFGAVKVLRGREFRYPLIGARVQRFLNQKE